MPAAIYFVFRLIVFAYDAQQPNFAGVQNGVMHSWYEKFIAPFVVVFWYSSQLLYYAFSLQLYWWHRSRIGQFFSNTQKVELNWIRIFLFLHIALFIIEFTFSIVDNSVISLHWTQHWWTHLATSVVLIYVGMKGYFSDYTQFKKIDTQEVDAISEMPIIKNENNELDKLKEELLDFMNTEKPYLNPDISLTDLAKMLNWSANTLSQTINNGFERNFKDFINEYRVNTFKNKVKNGAHEHLSLLGIAFDSGFNSKATFNRTFKKFVLQTPSEFVKNIKT